MIGMTGLTRYVLDHTERGECQCGQCIDKQPEKVIKGHTVDMVFFKVAMINKPTVEEFKKLTKEWCYWSSDVLNIKVDPLDGKEHSYIELGAWIEDQGLAMQYMALGVMLGVFQLLSPKMFPGIDDDMAMKMAGNGLLSVMTNK